MKTDLTFDVMEKILPDICALFDDRELDSIKTDIRNKRDLSTKDILTRLIPAFVTRHREETVRIIAAISGKAPEEIETQDFSVTLKDVNGKGLEQMLDFFAWCLRLVLKM